MPGPYLVSLSQPSQQALSLGGWWSDGSSVKLVGSPASELARTTAVWAFTTSYSTIPVNGSISATVLENSTAIPYCTVYLYYRPNGFLIATKKTNVDGTFTFDGLDPTDAENYFIVALDPAGGVVYNGLIFDRLTAT